MYIDELFEEEEEEHTKNFEDCEHESLKVVLMNEIENTSADLEKICVLAKEYCEDCDILINECEYVYKLEATYVYKSNGTYIR